MTHLLRALVCLPLASALQLSEANVPMQVDRKTEGGEDRPLRRGPFGPDLRRCTGPLGAQRMWDESTIVGGTEVNSGDRYPFLAWIGDDDGTGKMQFCGGSLISERIVLTAAHCLYEKDAQNAEVYVRFRLADFSRDAGIARRVVNWKQHEEFRKDIMTDDVALLLLNESVPASLVAPVALPDGTGPVDHGNQVVIVGWGTTDQDCKIYDTKLREATVPMGQLAPDGCSTPGATPLSPEMDFNYDRQICAGKVVNEASKQLPSCGDSGGPLLAQSAGGWTQVGIDSWGYLQMFPEVFTRVSAYRSWIDAASAVLLSQGANSFAARYKPKWLKQQKAPKIRAQ